jgi:hypothetical protein
MVAAACYLHQVAARQHVLQPAVPAMMPDEESPSSGVSVAWASPPAPLPGAGPPFSIHSTKDSLSDRRAPWLIYEILFPLRGRAVVETGAMASRRAARSMSGRAESMVYAAIDAFLGGPLRSSSAAVR